MGFIAVRPATDDDKQRMDDAAQRFLARHPEIGRVFAPADWGATRAITNYVGALGAPGASGTDAANARRIGQLWQRVARRALREPHADGIAWDSVGYWVEG